MKKNTDFFRQDGKRLVLSQSMKGMGWFGFLLGGAFIFFAAFLIWAEVYWLGAGFLIFGLGIVGGCSRVVIDKQQTVLKRTYGIFIPIIPTARKSIEGATGISVTKNTSKHKSFGSKISSTMTLYNIGIELPAGTTYVDSFDKHGDAMGAAGELALFLGIGVTEKTKR